MMMFKNRKKCRQAEIRKKEKANLCQVSVKASQKYQ